MENIREKTELNVPLERIEYEQIPLIGIGLNGSISVDDFPPWSRQSDVTPEYNLTPQIVYSTAEAWNANLIPLWAGEDLGLPLAKKQTDEIFTYGLSFWCQGDAELMDQCFRASECYLTVTGNRTQRWDRTIKGGSGMTHGERQIEWCNDIMDICYPGEYLDNPHGGPQSDPGDGVVNS